jgi:hypothetical protein
MIFELKKVKQLFLTINKGMHLKLHLMVAVALVSLSYPQHKRKSFYVDSLLYVEPHQISIGYKLHKKLVSFIMCH